MERVLTVLENLQFAIMPKYETKEPVRATEGAAGIDIFLPTFNQWFLDMLSGLNDNTRMVRVEGNKLLISPQCRVLIPTGVYFNIPEGTYLDVGTKSGRFKATGLKVGSHVIDYDYQGEILISLFNTSKLVAELTSGQSIAQLIHKEYIQSVLVKRDFDHLFPFQTERGESGFGSTDGVLDGV